MAITGDDLIEKIDDDFLSNIITKGLAKTEFRKPNSNGRLYVSNNGHCARKGVLDAKYEGEYTFDGVSTSYMEIGKVHEKLVNTGLYNQRLLLFENYNLPDIGINLGGRIDSITKHNGKIYIYEIKSCGFLPKELDDVKHSQYKAQALIYSAVTGLPSALVFSSRMVAKGRKLAIKPFDLGFNVDDLKDVMHNTVYAHLCANENIMPDKPIYFEQDKHCMYCPFVDICWNGKESHVPEGTAEQYQQINQEALDFVNEFMKEENINKRRNGVLKHITENGTPFAKQLKKEDWSKYL